MNSVNIQNSETRQFLLSSTRAIKLINHRQIIFVEADDNYSISWYVRDASGNILATYYKDASTAQHLDEVNLFGASRIGMAQANTSGTLNKYVYELSNHIGNLRATVSKDATSTLNLESYADYYPFGMTIPGR